MLLGNLAGGAKKFRTNWPNAAFTLDWFNANRTYGAVKLTFQVLNIVKADEIDSGQQRRERIAIFRGGGGR